LFYWLYSVYGDCEHVNDALIRQLPVSPDWRSTAWTPLWTRLQESLSAGSVPKRIRTKQGETIEYDEYDVGLSKPIIDEIDQLLARHYGFTDEELDFIINYDIKYRMGKDAGEE
jgi:hypothetical protein